jgi:hypothetical protein
MNRGTHRYIAQRQAIAGLDRRCRAGLQYVAGLHTLGSYDVASLAVRKKQQRYMSGAVRVIFDSLYLGRDTVLGALEIDDAIMLLMTTTNVPGSYPAIVIPATVSGLRLQQGLVWRPLVQTLGGDPDDVTTAR